MRLSHQQCRTGGSVKPYCSFEVLGSYCRSEHAGLAQKSLVLLSAAHGLRARPLPLGNTPRPSQTSELGPQPSPHKAHRGTSVACMEALLARTEGGDVCGASSCPVGPSARAEPAKRPSDRTLPAASPVKHERHRPQPDHRALAGETKGTKGPAVIYSKAARERSAGQRRSCPCPPVWQCRLLSVPPPPHPPGSAARFPPFCAPRETRQRQRLPRSQRHLRSRKSFGFLLLFRSRFSDHHTDATQISPQGSAMGTG